MIKKIIFQPGIVIGVIYGLIGFALSFLPEAQGVESPSKIFYEVSVLTLILSFLWGLYGLVCVFMGRSSMQSLVEVEGIPVLGPPFIFHSELYRREEKRLREEDAVRRAQEAIELLEEGEDIKESLESVAASLEQFGSDTAINAHPEVEKCIESLVKILLARRERQARERFYCDLLSAALETAKDEKSLSPAIAGKIREAYGLKSGAVGFTKCIGEADEQTAINNARDPVLQIGADDTLSLAKKIVALLKLEGITLNLED